MAKDTQGIHASQFGSQRPTCCADKKVSGGGTKSYGWYPQMKAECITFSEEKSTALVIGTNPGYQNAVLIVKNKR